MNGVTATVPTSKQMALLKHQRQTSATTSRTRPFPAKPLSALAKLYDLVEGERGTILELDNPSLFASHEARVTVRCSLGHTWTSIIRSITQRQSWCKVCVRTTTTLSRIKAFAKHLELEVLSATPLSHKARVLLRCPEHGEFENNWSSLKMGYGCPGCGNARSTMKSSSESNELNRLAHSFQGILVSPPDTTNQDHMVWQCSDGHVFERPLKSVLRGHFCQICETKTRRLSPKRKARESKMNRLASIIQERGGTLVSEAPSTVHQTITVQCTEGHIWSPEASNLLYNDTWCRQCDLNARREKSLEEKVIIAAEYGMTFVKQYNSILLWRCAKHHRFACRMKDLNSKSCPTCNPVEVSHPNLPRRKLRHKEPDSPIRKRISAVALVKDLTIEEISASQGWIDIVLRCDVHGLTRRTWDDEFKLGIGCSGCSDRHQAKSHFLTRLFHRGLQRFVCISKGQTNNHRIWQCHNGHIFERSLESVERGELCRLCELEKTQNEANNDATNELEDERDQREETLQILRNLSSDDSIKLVRFMETVNARLGRVVEVDSTGKDPTTAMVRLACKYEHTWETYIDRVNRGKWCPQCAQTSRLDSRVKQMASAMGYQVEPESIIPDGKIRLTCHIHGAFEKKWPSLREGYGCRRCGTKFPEKPQQSYDQENEELAIRKKCRLVSLEIGTKHAIWQCENGHLFERSTRYVAGGSFCEKCAGKHRHKAKVEREDHSTTVNPNTVASFSKWLVVKKMALFKVAELSGQVCAQSDCP